MANTNYSRWLKSCFLILALSGLGQSWSALAADAARPGRLAVLGDPYDATGRRQVVDQGRIVFYRPEGANRELVASLSIDEAYHTSLFAGAYSPICLPPATVRVDVRSVRVGEAAREGQDLTRNVVLGRGQTVYLRLSDPDGGGWKVQAVPEEEARADLTATRLQVHALSRVAHREDCRLVERAVAAVDPQPLEPKAQPLQANRFASPPQPAAVEPQAPRAERVEVLRSQLLEAKVASVAESQPQKVAELQKLVISGPAIFSYAGIDLTAEGRAEVDRVVASLRQGFERIDSLMVVGYTDPLGRRHESISRQRAESVLNYLRSKGVSAPDSRSEGRGAAELLVTHCGNEPTPAVIACHQPNRRIVVEVRGLPRMLSVR